MNIIRVALRTLTKNKVYALISVLGLALGITACLLVSNVVIDELSYDKHWKRTDDIYRIISVNHAKLSASFQKTGAAFAGLAPELKRNFSEIEEYSTLYLDPIDLRINKHDNQSFNVISLQTDTCFSKFLDIEFTERENLTPTKGLRKIIVSEQFASTYFPAGNALGKTIYDLPKYEEQANEYYIAGIIKNIPTNTHLRADIIQINNRVEKELNKEDWGMYVRHYVLLKPGTNVQKFEEKINTWYASYVTKEKPTQFELQSIKDSYLKSDFPAYQIIKGNIQHIYIFSIVAVLLLCIASINFINLSTARASYRMKETAVKKVLGASKYRLIKQFLVESLLLFLVSTLFAFLLYFLTLPFVEKFMGHSLEIRLNSHGIYFIGTILIIAFVSFLAGLYPAIVIARFQTKGLRKAFIEPKSGQNYLRSSLVVVQFSLSIMIIIALLVVRNQIEFMKNKDLGFKTDGLISINHVSWDNKYESIKNELNSIPTVQSISMSSWLPMDGAGYMTTQINHPQKPGEKIEVWYIAGETNLAETLGLKLKNGRLLNTRYQTDAMAGDDYENESNAVRPCVVTANTAHVLGIKNLDKPFEDTKLLPVGIVEDFNSESLHKALVPTVLVGYRNPPYGALLIRTETGQEQETMQAITKIWKNIYPDKILDMTTIQETLNNQYKAEEKIQTIFSIFSTLTLFLATLGIFGLVVHTIGVRTKEIGIRKVLGASAASITTMLSRDFIKLVVLAMIIASPMAWWAMNTWLEDFAYRIDIQWWMFVIAGCLAVLIALLTISVQSIKAALANPVDSLRDE